METTKLSFDSMAPINSSKSPDSTSEQSKKPFGTTDTSKSSGHTIDSSEVFKPAEIWANIVRNDNGKLYPTELVLDYLYSQESVIREQHPNWLTTKNGVTRFSVKCFDNFSEWLKSRTVSPTHPVLPIYDESKVDLTPALDKLKETGYIGVINSQTQTIVAMTQRISELENEVQSLRARLSSFLC